MWTWYGYVGAAAAATAVGALIAHQLFGPGIDAHNPRAELPLTDIEKRFLQEHVANAREETGYITRPRAKGQSVKLFYRIWFPKRITDGDFRAAKGIVVVLHGMNTHSARNRQLVTELLHDGFIIASIDHEGYGRSDGRHGYFASIHDLVDDAIEYIKFIRGKYPEQKVFVKGGSLGGLMVLHVLTKMERGLVDGAVILCPAVQIHEGTRPSKAAEVVGRFLLKFTPKLPFARGNRGRNSSPEVAAAVDADKQADPMFYNGRLRIGVGFAFLKAIEYIQDRFHLIDTPYLLQHGTGDLVCHVSGSEDLHQKTSSKDKTFKTYAGGYHDLSNEPPHIRDAVVNDFMSDSEEYEYEYDSDEQNQSDDQDAGTGDEGGEERNAVRETLIKLENTFYEAEDFRQRGDNAQALEYFLRVVDLERDVIASEPSNVKWSFQALENVVKLCVGRQQWDDMLTYYQQMLSFLAQVTRNESTESISSILDVVSAATGDNKATAKYTSKMYEITLEKLKAGNNDRLWFSMNVKLGKLFLEVGEFGQLRRLLDQLYEYCRAPDGAQDNSKATALMEVYALDIQWCGATKNSAKLRTIYPRTLDVDAALCDPRVMGVIREEGGKMYMEEGQWMLAYNEFFESFRNYQEAGNSRATQCLKYVVLANMLASSDINPFDSREAKVYQDVEEIGAMLLLRGAYESNDIVSFEKILRNSKYKLLSDPIMMKYLNPLVRNIRSQVMKKMVQPYRSIKLSHIASAMRMTPDEVEEIATQLIQNHDLNGKIDQVTGLLVLERAGKDKGSAERTFDALQRWVRALETVHTAVVQRVPAA
ncbi:TPA: hypothetical protein N0F65_011903 [Lagenidium giganteum]|uniref:PCI domain-containing protein n=1 Tax=Lagenidium giganteum TaxID=4803 RepID=A0AAV2YUC2_9STRA|nr:TPA: hypothetical protein N0F65_011903 [Lagenidium giganteum]